jgi:hypothetical protein
MQADLCRAAALASGLASMTTQSELDRIGASGFSDDLAAVRGGVAPSQLLNFGAPDECRQRLERGFQRSAQIPWRGWQD